jgi:hypothetical protein
VNDILELFFEEITKEEVHVISVGQCTSIDGRKFNAGITGSFQ